MKEKILAIIRVKYQSKGFSAKTLNAIADALAVGVTEETEIDAAVTAFEPLLSAFQSETDRRVEAVKPKPEAEKPEGGKKPDGGDGQGEPKADDVAGLLKQILEQNKTLQEKVAAIEQGKSTDTRKAQLEAALANVNAKFKESKLSDFELINFPDEEKFNAWLEKTKTAASEFAQQEADEGLGKMGTPSIPGATPKGSFVEMMGKIGETAKK